MKLINNSILYIITTAFYTILSFALIKVCSVYLSKEEFGVYNVINSLIIFLTPIFLLALNSTVSRFYFDYKENPLGYKKFIGQLLCFVLIIDILWCLIIIIGKSYITYIIKNITFYPNLLIALFITMFSIGFAFWTAIMQVQQKAIKYSLVQLSYSIIIFTGVFFILGFLKLNITEILIYIAFVNITFFIAFLWFNKIPLIFSFEKKIIFSSLTYSIPLIFHSLAAWATTFVNKIFINNTLGLTKVSVYEVGFLLCGIINLVSGSINQAYSPWFINQFENSKDSQPIIKITELLTWFYSLLYLMLSLFSAEIIGFVFSKNFSSSYKIVPILGAGFVCNGIYYFFVAMLIYKKKYTKNILIGTVSGGIINIILNIILTKKFEIIGSAVSSCIALLFLCVIMYFLSEKAYYIGYNIKKILFPLLLSFILSSIVYMQIPINFIQLIILKLFILLLFFYLFALFKYRDLKFLAIQIKNVLNASKYGYF